MSVEAGWNAPIPAKGDLFPSTRWSMIVRAKDHASPARREALEELCRHYWKPIYQCVRMARRTEREQTEDLTQEFFAEILTLNLVDRYSPDRGSFRKYVKGALHRFLLKERRDQMRLKRGGGRRFFSLEDDAIQGLERRAGVPDQDPEAAFDAEWTKTVLDRSVDRLRSELAGAGKGKYFEAFERFQLCDAKPTYAEVADRLQVKESDVSNYLMYCRTRLRDVVREEIREYVACESEVAEELHGVWSMAGERRG